jgi:Uncharacterized conserved protein
MKKILKILTVISSLFIIFCYGIFLVVSVSQGSDLSTILIGVGAIIIALIPIIFIDRMWTWLKWIFCIGMCCYVVSFIAFSGYILSGFDEEIPSDENLLIMVYGCRTYEKPSKSLRERLDAALVLLNDYPDSICVVTGGQGNNEPITEAESMRTYLIEKGIDESRIYPEDKSSSTVENIEFTRNLIEYYGLQDYKVVGVSTDFHLRRIRILCDTAGFETLLVPARSPEPVMLLANVVREYMSYVKMFLLHV